MIIALIGDLHKGVKGGDLNFLMFQIAYIKYFLEQCRAKGVTHIIQAGDFFDSRKSIDNRVLHYLITEIIPMCRAAGIKWTIIVGNHDIYYRESNKIHSTRLLQELAPDVFKVYNKTTDVFIGDTPFLLMPWLDDDNIINMVADVAQSKSTYAIMHADFDGFPMYKGSIAESGLKSDLFNKFAKVFTGHFHTVSSQKNIQYLGSPYHLTWADVIDGENRGFWLLDTATGACEMIKNQPSQSLFVVFEYDPDHKYIMSDLEPYECKIIKVVVKEKKDEKLYKNFIKLMNDLMVIDYRVIDQTINEVQEIVVDEETLHLDTMQILEQYIDGQETVSDKAGLKLLANKIYQMAVVKV